MDEGRHDADVAEHLCEADGHIVNAVGHLRYLGHIQLRHGDGVSSGHRGVSQLQDSAQVRELERRVYQVVKSGRDQQSFQETIQEQAKSTAAADDVCQSGNSGLYHRPYQVAHHAEGDGYKNHNQERETHAGEHLHGSIESLVVGAVEHIRRQTAKDDSAEHAHVHALDAQDFRLARTYQAQHLVGLRQLSHGA